MRLASAGAAPIAANVQHSAELAALGREPIEQLPAGLERESSQIVYCGTEQQIGEGFAIALRAMGFETEILLSDIIPQSNTTSNPEDG